MSTHFAGVSRMKYVGMLKSKVNEPTFRLKYLIFKNAPTLISGSTLVSLTNKGDICERLKVAVDILNKQKYQGLEYRWISEDIECHVSAFW